MSRVLILLGAVVALYAALVALVFVLQRAMLYPAFGPAVTAAEAGLAGFEDVALATPDGERLAGWYRAPEPGRAVLLYFHGNGGSLLNRRDRARLLTSGGRGLLLVTYRGYPGSTGRPSEAGLHLDADTAYAWLRQRFPPRRIVLYGESLGSGVAVRLAAERPVGGLVLDAPFTSAADVAAGRFWFMPVRLLMRDQYRSAERVGRVRAPLLVLHGDADRVVPFALGERLFAAAPEPKRLVRIAGGDHLGNLERAPAEVRAFLAEAEARLPPAAEGASDPGP